MSSKQERQARDAEANKARRAEARREREDKRAATTTPPSASATMKVKSQATPRQPRPQEPAILIGDVAVFEPEDREGRLSILLMTCVLVLLALLIIAVLKAAAT